MRVVMPDTTIKKQAAIRRGLSLCPLIGVAHRFFDIEPWVYFFAGVEDVVGITQVFGLFE